MRDTEPRREPTGTLSFVRPDGIELPVLTTYAVRQANGTFDGSPVIAAMLGQAEFAASTRFRTKGALDVIEEAMAIDGDHGFLKQIAPLFDRPIAHFLSELCEFAPRGGTFVFAAAPQDGTAGQAAEAGR